MLCFTVGRLLVPPSGSEVRPARVGIILLTTPSPDAGDNRRPPPPERMLTPVCRHRPPHAFQVQPPNLADLLASTKPSGSAVLPAAAMMQHSCAPNTMLMFPEADATFQFVASTDLAAGDELFISYIDETQGVAARQEELRRGYGFDCRCEACVEEFGGGLVG